MIPSCDATAAAVARDERAFWQFARNRVTEEMIARREPGRAVPVIATIGTMTRASLSDKRPFECWKSDANQTTKKV